jgi:glycosyltransferase involved in cell wall biosynthesis
MVPKSHITYVTHSLADGGAERQIIELIRNLDRSRFGLSLVLLEGLNSERAMGLVDHLEVLHVPFSGNSRWLQRTPSLIKAAVRLGRLFRQWQTDLVHAYLPAPCILSAIAGRIVRVPLIVASRRSLVGQYRSKSRIIACVDRLAVRLSHFNLGNCNAVTQELVRIDRCPPDRVGTVFNGVDTRRFHPSMARNWRAALGWTDQNIGFGMVANFRACKRQVDFVDAAAAIAHRCPEARFLMAGMDGGTLSEVKAQVQRLGLTELFRIVENDHAPEKFFAAMDVCVCASESEGFSNVLLEAMASGKPVIATSVGGNTEAVIDGETGFVVPPYSPEAIQRAALRLAADPNLRGAMGMLGRKRVETNFSVERMVDCCESLYVRLLGTKRRLASHLAAEARS